MLSVVATHTHFQKHHKYALGRALSLNKTAPNTSISTIKRTARKRSLQERCVDLSLASALLGSFGVHHQPLNNGSIWSEGKTFVPRTCFAQFKLSIFTRKKHQVVMQ